MMPENEKNCKTCKYEKTKPSLVPCIQCRGALGVNFSQWEPKPDKQQAEKTKLQNLDKRCENCGNVCSVHNSICISCHEVWERTGELKEWQPKAAVVEPDKKRHVCIMCSPVGLIPTVASALKMYGIKDQDTLLIITAGGGTDGPKKFVR